MVLHWRSNFIIAHRGASAYAPENTLAAFKLAIQNDADAIELDTKLTSDGQVVVIHDQAVDRTTDGTGKVKNLTLEQLRELDAGHHFGEDFQHQKIPTLEEVFKVCANKILFNIELTNYLTPFDSLAEKILHLIEYFALEKDVLISSFNPITLRRFQKLSPIIPVGLLAKSGAAGFLSRSQIGRTIVPYQAISPEKGDVSPKLVKVAHKYGQCIFPYTANKSKEIKELFKMGVDGIITDDPLLARRTISANEY